MTLWEAFVRAALTTVVMIVIVSVYEKKLLLFPVVPGIVSLGIGYLAKDATVGALTYLAVYAIMAMHHPMRERQLEHDEQLLEARHHMR